MPSDVKQENAKPLPLAVVLAGGLGTRLRPAYASGPKSMAPVGGKPFLDYLLTWLRAEGVDDVILCVGYKRTQIQRYVGGGRNWGLRVRYSIERELLGTGGAVKKAERLITGERLLVINGDTLVRVNLRELVKFHVSRRGWATMTVVRVADDERYGSLRMDREGRIVAFVEKGHRNTNNHRRHGRLPINGGVYVLEKKFLHTIRARAKISLEKDVFPGLAAKGRCYGFETDTYFVDIGVPDDLRRAQSELHEWFGLCNPD